MLGFAGLAWGGETKSYSALGLCTSAWPCCGLITTGLGMCCPGLAPRAGLRAGLRRAQRFDQSTVPAGLYLCDALETLVGCAHPGLGLLQGQDPGSACGDGQGDRI